MSDLVEFLLARIAEDEQRSQTSPYSHVQADYVALDPEDAREYNAEFRNRVLAECEAKRRIIEWHENWPVLIETQPTLDVGPSDDLSTVAMRMTRQVAWMTEREYRTRFGSEPPTGAILRLLALPYADHPDYRDEWRPTA